MDLSDALGLRISTAPNNPYIDNVSIMDGVTVPYVSLLYCRAVVD